MHQTTWGAGGVRLEDPMKRLSEVRMEGERSFCDGRVLRQIQRYLRAFERR